MFVNISRKKLFKSKWTYIFLITILACISAIIYMLLKIELIKYGKKIILSENSINIQSYYMDYDMTVISNKNINTYYVKEWYKLDIGSRFEYIDGTNNITTIITNNKNCYIFNSNNKLKLIMDNIYGNKNISSLSTFIQIYNSLDSNCKCSKKIYEKNNEITAYIFFDKNDICNVGEVGRDLRLARLEFSFKNNIPKSYIIYDENQNEYISIVYRESQINIDLEDEIFDIK